MNRTNTITSQELGRGRVAVRFLFQGNTSSDVSLATVVGVSTGTPGGGSGPTPFLQSITHSATGILLVTLNDTFNKLLFARAEVVDDPASPDAARATISNISNEGTATPVTFKIHYWTGGTPTATDPPAGRAIMVDLVLRNSTSD